MLLDAALHLAPGFSPLVLRLPLLWSSFHSFFTHVLGWVSDLFSVVRVFVQRGLGLLPRRSLVRSGQQKEVAFGLGVIRV